MIPSISNTVSKSHENFCKANVDTLKNTAKEYYTDYQSLKPKTIKSYYIKYQCGNSSKTVGPYYKSSSGSTIKVPGKTIHNDMPKSWLSSNNCSTTIASKNPQNHEVRNGGTMVITLKANKSPINNGECNIRGNTKRPYPHGWPCDHGHWRTDYYTRYCVDGNGKLQTKKSNRQLVQHGFACTDSPYHARDGWYVVDDRRGELAGVSKFDIKIIERPNR